MGQGEDAGQDRQVAAARRARRRHQDGPGQRGLLQGRLAVKVRESGDEEGQLLRASRQDPRGRVHAPEGQVQLLHVGGTSRPRSRDALQRR